uniref:mitochondrial ribosome-associated GTPase 2-like n=1 Tax=Styela clava TaxID=7725 RepID=UPI00193A44CF|nr:mitochondrial ribosome-associated GTPase 2-like [Styela clava]
MLCISHRIISLFCNKSCHFTFICNTFSISSQYYRKKKIITGKPYRTEEELAQKFIDHKLIKVYAGKGGDGRSSFLREKNRPMGGPDGGNGGNGGNVVFVADSNMKSLEKLLPLYQADDGIDGGGYNCFGKNGKDKFVKFPVGTYFRCEDGSVVEDLVKHGDEFVAAYGGLGGKGNRFFVTNTETVPEECTPGQPGDARVFVAELRTLAHAGLIGFPNAGKSTLLRILTRARPQVGDYQFTTLRPHVGILHFEDFTQIAIADIPGIIEGAHKNQGLGLTFLRHIERCRFFIFLLDLSEPDPWQHLQTLRKELSEYEKVLSERPSIYVANKLDLPEAKEHLLDFTNQFKTEFGEDKKLVLLSGKYGQNLEELIHTIRYFYDEDIRVNQMHGMTSPMRW